MEERPCQTPPAHCFRPSRLAALAEIGEERSAPAGALLYRVGDRTLSVHRDPRRRGRDRRCGRKRDHQAWPLGLPRGAESPFGADGLRQRARDRAVRYIAVERVALRALLNEDGPLSDLLLSTFITRREGLQSVQGIGMEIVGPRSSGATMRLLDFARATGCPYTWQDRGPPEGGGALPLVRMPGGASSTARAPVRSCARSGSASSSPRARRSTSLVVGGGPAGLGPRSTAPPKGSTRSSSRVPRSEARPARPGGSRTTSGFPRGSAARS